MRIPTRNSDTEASGGDSCSSRSPNAKRRRFLVTLGFGSAGAAVSAAASVSAAAEMITDAPAPPADGYQESTHVRDYYRTAKI